MTLSPFALMMLGLMLAGWTLAALWAVVSSAARARAGEAALARARRLSRLVEESPAQMLIDFDHDITREDKAILESTDPDAVIDQRRRGVEFSMDSDRPGMLIRKQLMELLARHGEAEVHR